MQNGFTAVLGLSLLLCAACDLVRLPSEAPETVTETASTDTAPGTTKPDDPNTTDRQPSDATLADLGTTPSTNETPPDSETDSTLESAEVETQPTPVTDLAALNAETCGLAVQPSDGSPTLAEVSGARPSGDDDIVGTATINGTAARLTNFPGLVKMEPRAVQPSGAISSGHCGATRIAENWFITAAHCLDDDYDEVRLIAGAENLKSPWATVIEAEVSLCHAAYGGARGGYVNDLALLRISDESKTQLDALTTAIYAMTDERFLPFNYEQARMAGWGLTAFNGSLSNTLLTADLSVADSGPAAINVRSQDGAGPCIGDSGGPLFVDEADGQPRLVGVLSVVEQNTSTGRFCEGDYGARYTNLLGYRDWILGVIETCEANPALCGF